MKSLRGFPQEIGFKHSETTKQILREIALGRGPRKSFNHTEDTKLKMSLSNSKSQAVILTNIVSGEFTSVSKAAKFIGASLAHVARCLIKDQIYKGKGYTIIKKVNLLGVIS